MNGSLFVVWVFNGLGGRDILSFPAHPIFYIGGVGNHPNLNLPKNFILLSFYSAERDHQGRDPTDIFQKQVIEPASKNQKAGAV